MFDCNNIYSVWDKRLTRGIKNYRRLAKNVDYKGTRDASKNEKVFSYEDDTTALLNTLGIKNMYPNILEADDVIHWLSKEIPGQKVIVSVDQDMLQLINDQTFVYSPIKDIIIDESNFEEKTSVTIDNFIRYKSLVGDKSDNLPGLDRCGTKTAAKLVREHATDTSLEEKIGKDKLTSYYTNLDLIDLSRGLVHHPEEQEVYRQQYVELKSFKPDFDKFIEMCEDRGMNMIIKKKFDWKSTFADNTRETLESIVNKLNLAK